MQSQIHRPSRLKAACASPWLWPALVAFATLALYLSTLQLGINGSQHPYTTDVGEIQNALPRWGTIHYPGYPLYSLLGSLFVTLLRALGVEPAAGSSLFSALWGVATAALLYALARELGARPLLSALGALAAALSTSLWVDSSLAEIHTMGLALTLASLCFALRFGRYGRRGDLMGLALSFSQGLAHQRTTLFLAPAVLLLVWPHRRKLCQGWPATVGVILLAPLTYLYLPIRAWSGATWTFGAVGTWRGFLSIFLDTKVDRIVVPPQTLADWLARLRLLGELLHDDLWLPVLILGLLALWLSRREAPPWREPLALTLAWLPFLPLCLVIWEGGTSDALLAAKLPLPALAGVGLALAAEALARRARPLGLLAAALLLLLTGAEVRTHRPEVLAITRNQDAERAIALAEQIAQPESGAPTTFMALWGHRYWALAYAQAYRGQLAGLTLVDHNADLSAIAAQGERLLTFSETFYRLPLAWWEDKLGHVHLSSPAPGIVEVSRQAAGASQVPPGEALDLENGIRILSATLRPTGDGQLVLTVYWQASHTVEVDYSVAVHLLAKDPPQGPGDILAQADRQHPVDGWYPTSRWEAGEVVRDSYLLTVPSGSHPVAVRVGMYTTTGDGAFHNSPWLTLRITP